jgi:hypothetical protein
MKLGGYILILTIFCFSVQNVSAVLPPYFNDNDTSFQFSIALTATSCNFPFEELETIFNTKMPKDDKDKVGEKILVPFLECISTQASEEERLILENGMLHTIINQGGEINQKSDQIIELQQKIIVLEEENKDQSNQIIKLQNESTTNNIFVGIGSAVISIVGTLYFTRQKSNSKKE